MGEIRVSGLKSAGEGEAGRLMGSALEGGHSNGAWGAFLWKSPLSRDAEGEMGGSGDVGKGCQAGDTARSRLRG